MIGGGSVGRRYARALFEVVRPEGGADAAADDLERAAGALAIAPELRRVLTAPGFHEAERRAVIDAIGERLALGAAVRRFLHVLLDRGRIDAVPECARELRRLADRDAGRVRATIESARELSADAAERVRRALERATGGTVVLTTRVDPDLIGGLRAQVGSTLYDGTLRARLRELREALVQAGH